MRTPSPAVATFAAFTAVLVGLGLARFAYTPLMPALSEAGWVSPEGAAWAGAANLAGYLAGALLGPKTARAADARPWLRFWMLFAGASLALSAAPLGFLWLTLWRFTAGVAGGVLVIVGPATALTVVPAEKRGRASGAMLTGAGLGIALSGIALPKLLAAGLVATWLVMGAACAVLAAASWRCWPGRPAAPPPRPQAARAFLPIHLAYALCAVGLVPHMIFLIDHVVRGLGHPVTDGAMLWTVFGLGALCGPLTAGTLVDRIGPVAAMRAVFSIEALAMVVPALTGGTVPLVISAFIVGGFVPGCGTLVLSRLYSLGGSAGAWAVATIAFSVGQAAAAFVFSALFSLFGTHGPGFVIGALVQALAVVGDVFLTRRPAPPESPQSAAT